MALQVFYHCQNHLLFPLYVRCPSAILIFLQDFLRLAFLPFILRYILRITFTSNKVFYFSQVSVIACHLPKIQLKLERKAWFYLAQNFRFFISKTFDILFRKKDVSWNNCSWIFYCFTFLLLAIFLKIIFNQKEKHGFIWSKTFNFLFIKHSKIIQEKELFLEKAVPEFKKYKKK